MQRLVREVHRRREDGATIVTVALFMTIILGFIGLGIDGAAVYSKRQHVQTGADAAAFALAQEYALSGCVEDSALALTYAQPNVPNENATTGIDRVVCSANSVQVVASARQSPFFLAAVGANPIRVPASATVEWGSPVAGTGFPLTFSDCIFESSAAVAGSIIEVWVPDMPWNASHQVGNPCASRTYPPGGFGWLDVGEDCTALYRSVEGGPVMAPGDTGNNDGTGCDWSTMVGTTVLVPIFSDTNGENGSNAEFLISKFAAFELLGVQIHPGTPSRRYASAGAPSGWCTVEPTWGKWKKHCINGRFVEYVTIDDAFEIGPITDPRTLVIRLRS